MRKCFLLLLMLFGLGFTTPGHAQTFYVTPEIYKYDNDISFNISQVTQLRKLQTGSFYFTPDKGYKAYELYIVITNHSNDTKDIDFENFFLLDSVNKIRYVAKYSMGEGLVGTVGRMQPTINKGETKRRKLVFAFPERSKPEFFMANGIIHHLHYTDKPPAPVNSDSSDENQ